MFKPELIKIIDNVRKPEERLLIPHVTSSLEFDKTIKDKYNGYIDYDVVSFYQKTAKEITKHIIDHMKSNEIDVVTLEYMPRKFIVEIVAGLEQNNIKYNYL